MEERKLRFNKLDKHLLLSRDDLLRKIELRKQQKSTYIRAQSAGKIDKPFSFLP